MVIVEEAIKVPLTEKSAGNGFLVYTSNREVKDTPIEDTSTKEKEDIGKLVGKFFGEGNETFAALIVLISIGKQQHRTKFQPPK